MSSITRVSGLREMPYPLALCCHDAGAANLIAAWCGEGAGELRLCAEGPAREIFARETPFLMSNCSNK
jgi:hypothetical protein